MKDHIIKLLGGYTQAEMKEADDRHVRGIIADKELAAAYLRDQLKEVPVKVRGDHPCMTHLECQKDFINALCKVLQVEKIW